MNLGNTSKQEGVSIEPPLPEGWEKRTASSGRVYYYDYNTRSATFDRPTTRPTPCAPPAISNSFDCLGRGGSGSGGGFPMRGPAAPLAQAAPLTPGYSSAWRAGSADGGSSLEPPLPPELKKCNDGSLGYVLGGTFEQMYGPPVKSKDVWSATRTQRDSEKLSFQQWGFGFENVKTRERTDSLPNLLFSCDWLEDNDPVFVQQPWPLTDDGVIVRAFHPGALRGGGAMVRSLRGMVYVMDATLPTNARRGYLAVQGPEKVEKFLKDISWETRCEGYMGGKTDKGEHVRSFVVNDLSTDRGGTGYYVLSRYSDVNHSRLICHLKPIGALKDTMRCLGVVPYKGLRTFYDWTRARFPDADWFLFD